MRSVDPHIQWNAMSDRYRNRTLVRLIIFGAFLAFYTIMVESRTYFVPSSQKMAALADGYRDRNRVREYTFDEVENEIDPPARSTAISVYRNSDNRFKHKRRYDDYSFGDYGKDQYDEYPALPPSSKASEVRGIQHITVSDHKLAHIASMIASSLKYLLIALLAVGIPILAVQFLLIPLKLLLGLKLIAAANMIVLGALATKYILKHKHGGGYSGYGGYGGYGGGGVGGLLGGLAAISTPVVTSNFQQPVSQPVTTVVTSPVQQQQNSGVWNYPYYGYPPWWFYYPGYNGTGSYNNSNTNTNTNTNINTNNNNNTNTNNNNNNNGINGNNGNNGNVRDKTKLRKNSKRTKVLDIDALKPEDFGNITKSEVQMVMQFLNKEGKNAAVL